MYYEINIALSGIHFFATAEHSITTESKLKTVLSILKKKFNEPEYSFIVTRYEKKGYGMNPNTIV